MKTLLICLFTLVSVSLFAQTKPSVTITGAESFTVIVPAGYFKKLEVSSNVPTKQYYDYSTAYILVNAPKVVVPTKPVSSSATPPKSATARPVSTTTPPRSTSAQSTTVKR